jgi:hypothetical protein
MPRESLVVDMSELQDENSPHDKLRCRRDYASRSGRTRRPVRGCERLHALEDSEEVGGWLRVQQTSYVRWTKRFGCDAVLTPGPKDDELAFRLGLQFWQFEVQ